MEYGNAGPDANLELSSTFAIELDGIAVMAFEKCTPGDIEWGVIMDRTGIDDLNQKSSSGLQKEITITLEKQLRVGGWADVNEMVAWGQLGSKEKKTGAIILYDREKSEIGRLNFEDAWVKKITSPELDAQAEDSAAVFTFELSVSKMVFA